MLALISGISCATEVTVDVTTTSAKSNTNDVECGKVVKKGEQFGVLIMSKILQPQTITLKFVGLSQQDYDLYLNGSYSGKLNKQTIEQGYKLQICGSIADQDMMRCLNALSPKVEPMYKELNKSSDSERKRVAYTLGQARDWVRSGIRSDELYRSVFAIIVPSDRALQSMPRGTRLNDVETARTITRACWLLQQARDRMYDVIKDPDVRNLAVTTLTPVNFSASCSVTSGRIVVKAKLVDNCNLPISASVSIVPPQGWRIKTPVLSCSNLKAGKAYEGSLVLVSLKKGLAAPKTLPVSANIKVVQDDLVAQCKFTVDAVSGSSASK